MGGPHIVSKSIPILYSLLLHVHALCGPKCLAVLEGRDLKARAVLPRYCSFAGALCHFFSEPNFGAFFVTVWFSSESSVFFAVFLVSYTRKLLPSSEKWLVFMFDIASCSAKSRKSRGQRSASESNNSSFVPWTECCAKSWCPLSKCGQ